MKDIARMFVRFDKGIGRFNKSAMADEILNRHYEKDIEAKMGIVKSLVYMASADRRPG